MHSAKKLFYTVDNVEHPCDAFLFWLFVTLHSWVWSEGVMTVLMYGSRSKGMKTRSSFNPKPIEDIWQSLIQMHTMGEMKIGKGQNYYLQEEVLGKREHYKSVWSRQKRGVPLFMAPLIISQQWGHKTFTYAGATINYNRRIPHNYKSWILML